MLAAHLLVDDDRERVIRSRNARRSRSPWNERQQLGLAGEVGDAVLLVDLFAEELRDIGVDAEAFLEADLMFLGELIAQGEEERFVAAEGDEGAAHLARPVVLDDGRHLAVVADDDELAVVLEGKGAHDGLGEIDLGGFVEDQQVAPAILKEGRRLCRMVFRDAIDPGQGARDDAMGSESICILAAVAFVSYRGRAQ